MLDELIAYLRAAMPHMRDTSSTVAREVELARAYLDIVRLRLGDRLSVSIDLPPATREVRMPPMMLLPLIDHAVVRGLEHRSGAGTIAIVATVDTGRLRLRIVDSGAAIVPDLDDAGIDTIKQRLDALYRGDATLELRHAETLASEAVLDLPLEARSPLETIEAQA
jgi:LytS/YehU family sensor histidine kinase